MAVKQYIGARYVPKFFENSSGTSEWRSNTIYEALTVVTRNGNSYTSKKPVPANVGAPENNPEYWVATGVYNEQFREYDRKIDAVIDGYEEADRALKSDIEAEIGTESTARAAADNVLRNEIEEEIENRNAAVLTVTNALNDEITNRTTADENLQTQIDEIVAPTGGAPSAEEVTNARIGANGTVYQSLGEAIRSQVGFLDDAVFDFAGEENVGFLSAANDGKLLNNQLNVVTNSAGSVTDYVVIPSLSTKIRVATKTIVSGNPSNIAPQVFFFDENKTYISRNTDTDTSHDYATFEIPENAVYVRVNQPAAAIAKPKYIRFIRDGLVIKEGLTSADDLNAIGTPGAYFLPYNNMPAHTPANMPANTSARLLVIKSVTAQNYSAAWQIMAVSSKIFFRTFTDGNWRDWQTVINESDLTTTVMERGVLNQASNLDTLPQTGTYFYTSPNGPEKAPTNAVSRMMVIRSRTPENYSAVSNLLVSNGGLFYRDCEANSTGFTEWKSVGVESPMIQDETLPYNAVLYHAKWDELLQNRVLRRINLGYVDSDTSLPMYAYEFCPKRDFVDNTSMPEDFDWSNALYPRPKVLIIGGQHGNEKCTPMDIWRIAKELKNGEYNELACKFDWYFIPLLNPWGYSHARLDSNGNVLYDNTGVTAEIVPCSATINAGIRENANGYNINRDWSDVVYSSGGKTYGFKTSELQLIKNYVLNLNPDFFIDAHQNHNNTGIIMTGVNRKANGDSAYNETINKIFRYIDSANGQYDTIFKKYKSSMANVVQYARVWPQITAATADHYFGGVTISVGGTTVGNTQHQSIATPYSMCTETSEICYDFSKTYDWYNWVACTCSTTYLWKIINSIAKLF